MRVSVDTDAGGAAELVAGVTRVNIRDALRHPELRRSLVLRCRERPHLLRYADDATTSPFRTDEWAAWSVLAQRYGAVIKDERTGLYLPGDDNAVIFDDCEGLASMHAAALVLCRCPWDVWVSITHPQDSDTAHAYNRIGPKGQTRVFDGSVLGGMRKPPSGWYDQAETQLVKIEPLSFFEAT